MGAINYGRNEFLNLGLNIFKYNEETIKSLAKMKENGELDYEEIENEELVYESMCVLYEDCEEIINELGRLNYYEIELKSGYYEGFYLDIDNSFSCYNGYEKQEAQKELTTLKKCLLRLIELGLVHYTPGWCTGYSDKEKTKLKLKEAVKKERERIRKIRVR